MTRRLERCLCVLSFHVGEQIICRNEIVSFCGVVLVDVFLGDAHRVALPKASCLMGEVTSFDGGKRTAGIMAAESCVLTVVS